MKNLPPNVKIMLSSTLPLVVVLILFVFAGRFGFQKISQVRAKIAEVKRDQTILSQKLALLSQVQESVSASGVALSALPEKNPSLITSSQIKLLAASMGLTVSSIKGGSEAKDPAGVSRVDITFDIDGARPQVLLFLSRISTFAPITLVDKVKVTETGGATRASVVVKSFWSKLPEKLPALTDQITDLTPDEKKTLAEISTLVQPVFVEVPASEAPARSDPFSP